MIYRSINDIIEVYNKEGKVSMDDELRNLYFRIENPIDNKIKWAKLLNIYSTSFNYEDFFSIIAKKEEKNTTIEYDEDEKNSFALLMWSNFKTQILKFTEEELRDLIDSKFFDFDIYDAILKIRDMDSVKNYQNLKEVLKDPAIYRYFSYMYTDIDHDITICSDYRIKYDPKYNTVLSIKVDASRLYKILKVYINECIKAEMSYFIKFNDYDKKIVINIFTSIANFKKNEEILSIIKKENYMYFYDNYDLLSGNINEVMTIRNKDVYNNYQYLRERTLIFFKSIDSVTYEYITNHMNILVSYKDGRMNIIEYLSQFVTERIINQLINKSIKTSQEYFLIANSGDLNNLKNYIKEKLSANLKDILNDRLYLKGDESIPLKLNENKTIKVDVNIIMSAIRNLTLTLMTKDSSLEKLYRVRIKNECQFYKVDYEKFCLDEGFAKKLFYNKNEYDNYQSELDRIHKEIEKVESLEALMSSEINDDTREKISNSMSELRQIFNLEEGN